MSKTLKGMYKYGVVIDIIFSLAISRLIIFIQPFCVFHKEYLNSKNQK